MIKFNKSYCYIYLFIPCSTNQKERRSKFFYIS